MAISTIKKTKGLHIAQSSAVGGGDGSFSTTVTIPTDATVICAIPVLAYNNSNVGATNMSITSITKNGDTVTIGGKISCVETEDGTYRIQLFYEL